jgi:hypothetical protein
LFIDRTKRLNRYAGENEVSSGSGLAFCLIEVSSGSGLAFCLIEQKTRPCPDDVRDLTIIFGIALLILSVIFDPSDYKKLMVTSLVILIFSGLSPGEITLKNVEGAFKIVTPCNIRQDTDLLEAEISKGECYLASDIPRLFEPKSKILW